MVQPCPLHSPICCCFLQPYLFPIGWKAWTTSLARTQHVFCCESPEKESHLSCISDVTRTSERAVWSNLLALWWTGLFPAHKPLTFYNIFYNFQWTPEMSSTADDRAEFIQDITAPLWMMPNHTEVFNLHFCIYQVQSMGLSLPPTSPAAVDHLKLSLALVAAAKDSRIESWTERKWLSELSIVEINRATRGEDTGGVITSVRRGPFLTKARYTESPLKSAALLLDVCWGWRRESAANRRLLIKGGSSRRCSHDIPVHPDRGASHLFRINNWGYWTMQKTEQTKGLSKLL